MQPDDAVTNFVSEVFAVLSHAQFSNMGKPILPISPRCKLARLSVYVKYSIIAIIVCISLHYATPTAAVSPPKTNFATLTHSLTSDSIAEAEKLRLIIEWIPANIRYDYAAFANREVSPASVSGILKSRKTDDYGLALLFRELCDYAGIPCMLTEGYYLGGRHIPGRKFYQSNHWWNIYLADGQWQKIDFACMAGHFVRPGDPAVSHLKPSAQALIWMEESFPAAEAEASHQAADPVMQLSSECLKPECFTLRTMAEDSCRYTVASFSDSLARELRMPQQLARLQSARRAFSFNPSNYRLLAQGWYGMSVWKLGQQISAAQPDSLALLAAWDGLEKANRYFLYEKEQIRTAYRAQIASTKLYYKPFLKEFTNYVRQNEKLIEKNQRNILKARQRKDALNQTIKKVKEANINLLADEKIVDVNRPKTETTVENEYLIIEMLKQYNSNANKINQIKENIRQIYDAGNNQLLSVYREVQVESEALLAEKIKNIEALEVVVKYSNPNLRESLNQKRYAIRSITDVVRKGRETGNYLGGDSFRENNKELKTSYSELQTLMKLNKNLLKEVKKRSFENRNEEALYMVENQSMAEENAAMVLRYEATIAQIDSEMDNMGAENRKLKAENKMYVRLVKEISRSYEAENNEEAQQYLFDKTATIKV